MEGTETTVTFEPATLKAGSRNEVYMTIIVSSKEPGQQFYWCESEISVNHPLTLSPDSDMRKAKTRVGILKPGGTITKKLKIFTRPNNLPDSYGVSVTTYLYGEDGTIAERKESKVEILAVDNREDKAQNHIEKR
jgi:hypothetical protein